MEEANNQSIFNAIPSVDDCSVSSHSNQFFKVYCLRKTPLSSAVGHPGRFDFCHRPAYLSGFSPGDAWTYYREELPGAQGIFQGRIAPSWWSNWFLWWMLSRARRLYWGRRLAWGGGGNPRSNASTPQQCQEQCQRCQCTLSIILHKQIMTGINDFSDNLSASRAVNFWSLCNLKLKW